MLESAHHRPESREKVSGSDTIRSSAKRFGPLLAAAALFAWLAYAITAGQPNFELHVFPATLRLQALQAIVLLVYGSQLVLRRRLPGPTLLDWPIAALLVVYCLAVATSIYPRVSLEATLVIAGVVLTLYAFHDFEFLSMNLMVRGVVAVGVIAAVVALVQVGSDYVKWLRLVDSVDGGLSLRDFVPPAVPRVSGLVNVLAMALNLALPFAVGLALRPVYRFERPLVVGATALILITLFFTLSRGAWLGTAAGLPVFVLFYVLRNRDPAALLAPIRRHPAVISGALIAAALILVVALALLAGRWDSRPAWLFRSSVSPRFDAANVGLEIFRDRPLLGSGPYTYSLLYSVYSGKYPVENIHPHNGYLNVLVDIGALGALVLLAGGALLLRALLRAYREGDEARRALLAACFASLTTLAVHSLADAPNAWSTALLPFALVLAIALRLARSPAVGTQLRPRETDDHHEIPVPGHRPAPLASSRFLVPRLLPRLAVAALFPALLIGWTAIDLPHADFNRSIKLLAKAQFNEAAAKAVHAADKDEASAAYQFNAGVNEAIAYLVAEGRGQRPSLSQLDGAIEHIQRGIAREPRSSVGYANLALALKLRADRAGLPTPSGAGSTPTEPSVQQLKERALEAAKMALIRGPTDGATAVAAGTVFEWAERFDEAAFAYSVAMKRDPGLVQSPFWASKPARNEMRSAVIDFSNVTPCQQGRVTSIYRGYGDNLEQLASACEDYLRGSPGDVRARADLAITLHAIGRTQEARTQAEAAVRAIPDDPYARTALGLVRGGERDIVAARHQLMLGAHLGDPDAALLLAYTYEPPRATNAVIDNVSLPVERGELPKPVIDRLRATLPAAAPFFYDDGRQTYLLGILYYRVRFLRESPTSVLIPGDWLELESPRALLILDALRGR